MLFLLAAALLVVGSLLGSPPSGPEEARMQTAAVWETELRKNAIITGATVTFGAATTGPKPPSSRSGP
jgi:hypothetical protein